MSNDGPYFLANSRTWNRKVAMFSAASLAFISVMSLYNFPQTSNMCRDFGCLHFIYITSDFFIYTVTQVCQSEIFSN